MSRPRGYLLDLDGTLISGRRLLPGVAALVAETGGRFAIVSNDAEHTPHELARLLGRLGLAVEAERIVLAGTTAIDLVAQRHPGARVMLLAGPALERYARRRGLRLSTGACDIVVVGRDRRFSYRRLAAAAHAVSLGARLVLACPDTHHRGPLGEPVPEVGALAASILSCAGAGECEVVGKPEPLLFRLGCERLGLPPQEVVMIGDNPATDGKGAIRAGMRFLHVLPGDFVEGLGAMERKVA